MDTDFRPLERRGSLDDLHRRNFIIAPADG